MGLRLINSRPTSLVPHSMLNCLDIACVPIYGIVMISGYLRHCNQFSLGAISDHGMLFLIMDTDINRGNGTQICFSDRDFKSNNLERLKDALSRIGWNNVLYLADVNNKVAYLKQRIHVFYNVQ